MRPACPVPSLWYPCKDSPSQVLEGPPRSPQPLPPSSLVLQQKKVLPQELSPLEPSVPEPAEEGTMERKRKGEAVSEKRQRGGRTALRSFY